MDIEVRKENNENEHIVQNVEGDDIANTDSVAISIEVIEEELEISNDLSQLNEKILNPPFPRAEQFKRTKESNRRRNVAGEFKSKNQRSTRAVWVQFIMGKTVPSEGPPLEYNPETRNDFVRKVFIILTAMLLLTFLIVIGISTSAMKDIFIKYGLFISISATILLMALTYAFSCSQCTRNPPCNYICLLLVVLAMSVICWFITMRYDTAIIILALLATVVIVFICALLACTNFDFTSWMLYVIMIMGALAVVSLSLAVASLAFGFYMKPLHIAILIIGLIMNSIMLVIELQMVLGGRAVELSEDDYALGAFMLYMSIVEIFLKLVQIIGLLNEND